MPARPHDGPMPSQIAAEALARPEDDMVGALLRLSAASRAITSQHYRIPTERERLALADAVAAIIRMGRMHGLDDAPPMGPAEAVRSFRAALRLALSAGVPRTMLVSIFNGDEDAAIDGRKDLQ